MFLCSDISVFEAMGSERHFKNEAEKATSFGDLISEENGADFIKESVKSQLTSTLSDMLQDIEAAAGNFDPRDVSMYTGMSGYALLYLHLYKLFHQERHLATALQFVDTSLKRFKGRDITFLCGDGGPLAVGAVAFHVSGQQEKCNACIERLISMLPMALSSSDNMPDELLYGRGGYLFSLLYVNASISPKPVPNDVIQKVISSIIESGKKNAVGKPGPPLSYSWYSEGYVGAAHGYAGIMFMLLQTDSTAFHDVIKLTTDFILGLQYPSGNFPASLEHRDDTLIHWCHGAPGCVYLMKKAYETFGDEKYLNSAHLASDTVWKRGLLKKGYGLCHGAAGNGYGFLAMYNMTKEKKYLYRALQFGIWCCGYKTRRGLRTPDCPYSLFEGIAGTAYLLADLLHFKNAKFPAFEL